MYAASCISGAAEPKEETVVTLKKAGRVTYTVPQAVRINRIDKGVDVSFVLMLL